MPRSQGVSVKLGSMLPRPLRETVLRAMGLGRIAGDMDPDARREYHKRAFGSD